MTAATLLCSSNAALGFRENKPQMGAERERWGPESRGSVTAAQHIGSDTASGVQ